MCSTVTSHTTYNALAPVSLSRNTSIQTFFFLTFCENEQNDCVRGSQLRLNKDTERRWPIVLDTAMWFPYFCLAAVRWPGLGCTRPQPRPLSVRPILVLRFRLLLWVAVLHSDASWQDGGHIISCGLPFLGLFLLSLLLNLPQLDPCRPQPQMTVRFSQLASSPQPWKQLADKPSHNRCFRATWTKLTFLYFYILTYFSGFFCVV